MKATRRACSLSNRGLLIGHGQSGKAAAPGQRSGAERLVRIAGARFRHGGANGDGSRGVETARASRYDAQRKFGAARCHLERLVGAGDECRHRQSNARYIQWRADFAASAGPAPAIDDVTVAYLPQNSAPVVRSSIVW